MPNLNCEWYVEVTEKFHHSCICLFWCKQEGHALKLLSTAARLDIEDFVGKEVYLEVSHPLQSCCFFPASFLSLQPTPQEGYIYGIMSDLSFDIWWNHQAEFSEFLGMNITCAEIFNCGFQLLPFGVSSNICNEHKSWDYFCVEKFESLSSMKSLCTFSDLQCMDSCQDLIMKITMKT